MSSTSAVAVLAQGLRELRDFAEGPDGEELRQRTGLTTQQIEAALGGQHLPTREATLALVEAWEGDVEAWHDYWGQISELAAQDEADRAKKTTPAPPEPSIITPIPETEREPEAEAEDEAQTEPDPESEPEGAEEDSRAVEDEEAAEVGVAAGAGRIAEAETEAEEATTADSEAEAETEEATATTAEANAATETEETATADVEANVAAGTEADETAEVESDAAENATAQSESDAADEAAAAAENEPEPEPARAEAGDGGVDGGDQADAEPGAKRVDEPVIPAQRSAESAQSVTAEAKAPPALEGVVFPAGDARPEKKSMLARAAIPVLVFVVGVGVGAFGDHALNSKQSSSDSSASVPPVSASTSKSASASVSSKASHSSAPSASGSAAISSSAASAGSTAGSTASSSDDATDSSSPSSTVAAGSVLGSYVGIQLASGYSVNFLSDSYHPQAGTADGPDTMGFFASSFVDGRFYADRVAVLDPTDTGSYTSCLNDTRYQHDVLLSQVAAGGSFCITTTTGHMVLVTVRRMPSSTDANPYAVLDVTVWQGAE